MKPPSLFYSQSPLSFTLRWVVTARSIRVHSPLGSEWHQNQNRVYLVRQRGSPGRAAEAQCAGRYNYHHIYFNAARLQALPAYRQKPLCMSVLGVILRHYMDVCFFCSPLPVHARRKRLKGVVGAPHALVASASYHCGAFGSGFRPRVVTRRLGGLPRKCVPRAGLGCVALQVDITNVVAALPLQNAAMPLGCAWSPRDYQPTLLHSRDDEASVPTFRPTTPKPQSIPAPDSQLSHLRGAIPEHTQFSFYRMSWFRGPTARR
ncbi:unnamed protein product [Pleuronectes platessa]|uniref:Uncharacterized protein n=1 Tax=Pleuronectes platessa TaxID=8262 RepID=A0A9N7Y5Y1_PLEPL|nr:unnamed protein product [Pleuronectes platessa]